MGAKVPRRQAPKAPLRHIPVDPATPGGDSAGWNIDIDPPTAINRRPEGGSVSHGRESSINNRPRPVPTAQRARGRPSGDQLVGRARARLWPQPKPVRDRRQLLALRPQRYSITNPGPRHMPQNAPPIRSAMMNVYCGSRVTFLNLNGLLPAAMRRLDARDA